MPPGLPSSPAFRKGTTPMCLAIPHELTELLPDHRARATAGTAQVTIRTDLLSEPRVGDVVLVHGGFAIERVHQEKQEELASLWEEVHRLAGR